MNAPAVTQPPRRSAAWWLRLLMVMLLVFDQVSAPMHRHHHDVGLDAVGMSADHGQADHHASVGLDDDDDDDDGAPSAHHASGGPRSGAGASVQSTDAGPDAGPAINAWLAASWLASLTPVAEVSWRLALALDRPIRPVPLSRPPDGRAPPARA